MAWNCKNGAFVIETYFKINGDSIIATQRVFCRHFRVGRHGMVPDGKSILLWVGNFRGSALKHKSSGRPRSFRTPENIAANAALSGTYRFHLLGCVNKAVFSVLGRRQSSTAQ
jgi:hypothetical protein